MFSDTHCHLFSLIDNETLTKILPKIEKNFSFVMDIGTKPNDFEARLKTARAFYSKLPKDPEFLRFSLGIWPSKVYVENAEVSVKTLEKNILVAQEMGFKVALGECGLDRYWNGSNAKHQNPESGTTDIISEELLFELQLKLAKKYNLPIVIHSRDAFSDTLKVIDKVGYHNGVIHCFGYSAKETAPFLERGWYISFSGNCTFAKTNVKKAETAALIRSVPLNKLLLETDSPYLTPAPYRGKKNNPLLVELIYKKVTEILNINMQTLKESVFKNATKLFG